MRPARCRRGMVSVEFALTIPILVLLAVGASDIVGLLRAQLRVDMVAQQLGQLVSQCNRINAPGDIEQFWAHAQRMAGGTGQVSGAGAEGAVIISAVGRINNANRITWQQRTGNANHSSSIGAAGATATLPGGFTVPAGQTLFVTEVFLPRETWPNAGNFMGGSGLQTLSAITLFLTRAADAPSLQTLQASSPQPSCTA